tara:strand:+ start:317 stop:502 length:186 start_codon:yes stop_codon:yes gene_type:complete
LCAELVALCGLDCALLAVLLALLLAAVAQARALGLLALFPLACARGAACDAALVAATLALA